MFGNENADPEADNFIRDESDNGHSDADGENAGPGDVEIPGPDNTMTRMSQMVNHEAATVMMTEMAEVTTMTSNLLKPMALIILFDPRFVNVLSNLQNNGTVNINVNFQK